MGYTGGGGVPDALAWVVITDVDAAATAIAAAADVNRFQCMHFPILLVILGPVCRLFQLALSAVERALGITSAASCNGDQP
ncbi:hypothetical protein GCM10022235_43490 [Kribbella ginsengisoli]|uniref:Uncharacterized protein n=1 Tax=Kribbella ginsengisoli TaxID=363865 RepID=A0ABP6XMA4_9ACTN